MSRGFVPRFVPRARLRRAGVVHMVRPGCLAIIDSTTRGIIDQFTLIQADGTGFNPPGEAVLLRLHSVATALGSRLTRESTLWAIYFALAHRATIIDDSTLFHLARGHCDSRHITRWSRRIAEFSEEHSGTPPDLPPRPTYTPSAATSRSTPDPLSVPGPASEPPVREDFERHHCGGLLSQCERRCGCVGMAFAAALQEWQDNQHGSTGIPTDQCTAAPPEPPAHADDAQVPGAHTEHVSMDANAIEHGPAANGAGPRTPFSEKVAVRPAYRGGIRIGDGLFATDDIREGEEIAAFIDGAYMRLNLWEFYCASHNLPYDWAGFLTYKGLPPPTKRVVQVMMYDAHWTSADTRPLWTYINHASTFGTKWNANCRPVVPTRSQDCRVVFYATCDIAAQTEIMFDYGGDTSDLW